MLKAWKLVPNQKTAIGTFFTAFHSDPFLSWYKVACKVKSKFLSQFVIKFLQKQF